MNPRNRALVLAGSVLVAGLGGYEGLELVDYWDKLPKRPIATACYGHTATAKPGTVRTKDECDALLARDLNTIYGPAVLRMVHVPITQGQYNALTDFGYNVGLGNLRHSTLLRRINAGEGKAACKELFRWTFVGGKDCKLASSRCGGIVKRRQWEYDQCVSAAAPTSSS